MSQQRRLLGSSCGCACTGKMPAIAALAYHRASGRAAAQPNQRLSYAENFLYMLDAGATPRRVVAECVYRENRQVANIFHRITPGSLCRGVVCVDVCVS